MVDAIEDDNEDNYRELLKLFVSIQKKSQQSNNNNIDSNGGNGEGSNSNSGIMDIRNPIIRRPKGRPKSKRAKSSLEQSNAGSNSKVQSNVGSNNKVQYKCKLCKQRGHNSKTCANKENDDNNDDENSDGTIIA